MSAYSLRRAAELADVSRAVARAVAADDLIPAGELDARDVVVLRAAAVLRTFVFPGESRPANSGRPVTTRERDAAAAIRSEELAEATMLLVTEGRVQALSEVPQLVAAVLEASASHQAHVLLPVGRWFRAVQEEAMSLSSA